MKPPTAATPGPVPTEWLRSARVWHIAFFVILAVQALLFITDIGQAGHRIVPLTCLAIIAVAYVTIGRKHLLTGGGPGAKVYLTILLVATLVAASQAFSGLMLLVIAYSHIWAMVDDFRDGLPWSIALGVGSMAVGFWLLRGHPASEIVAFEAQMAIWLVFAVGMGWWTHTIITQSFERAQLIDELRATQAELAKANHAAGVTAERERLAREIHDTLAQGFTSIIMLSQAARAGLDVGDTTVVRERVGLIESTARDNLAEARALVRSFSPVALQGTTIAEAVRRLADAFATETGVRVVSEIEDVDVPRPQEVVLLRAAQEALANVRKHSHASTVRVTLSGPPAVLRVVDDGVGAEGSPTGFGLRNLRDRVSEVGGELRIEATPHHGTTLTVRLAGAHG